MFVAKENQELKNKKYLEPEEDERERGEVRREQTEFLKDESANEFL